MSNYPADLRKWADARCAYFENANRTDEHDGAKMLREVAAYIEQLESHPLRSLAAAATIHEMELEKDNKVLRNHLKVIQACFPDGGGETFAELENRFRGIDMSKLMNTVEELRHCQEMHKLANDALIDVIIAMGGNCNAGRDANVAFAANLRNKADSIPALASFNQQLLDRAQGAEQRVTKLETEVKSLRLGYISENHMKAEDRARAAEAELREIKTVIEQAESGMIIFPRPTASNFDGLENTPVFVPAPTRLAARTTQLLSVMRSRFEDNKKVNENLRASWQTITAELGFDLVGGTEAVRKVIVDLKDKAASHEKLYLTAQVIQGWEKKLGIGSICESDGWYTRANTVITWLDRALSNARAELKNVLVGQPTDTEKQAFQEALQCVLTLVKGSAVINILPSGKADGVAWARSVVEELRKILTVHKSIVAQHEKVSDEHDAVIIDLARRFGIQPTFGYLANLRDAINKAIEDRSEATRYREAIEFLTKEIGELAGNKAYALSTSIRELKVKFAGYEDRYNNCQSELKAVCENVVKAMSLLGDLTDGLGVMLPMRPNFQSNSRELLARLEDAIVAVRANKADPKQEKWDAKKQEVAQEVLKEAGVWPHYDLVEGLRALGRQLKDRSTAADFYEGLQDHKDHEIGELRVKLSEMTQKYDADHITLGQACALVDVNFMEDGCHTRMLNAVEHLMHNQFKRYDPNCTFGVTRLHVDKVRNIIAEGLTTQANDIDGMIYCCLREVEKLRQEGK
ncbi:MAG: hypothetical protein WC869_01175 [Phycisphaerae bacterium]|jgi:hypothetical protein